MNNTRIREIIDFGSRAESVEIFDEYTLTTQKSYQTTQEDSANQDPSSSSTEFSIRKRSLKNLAFSLLLFLLLFANLVIFGYRYRNKRQTLGLKAVYKLELEFMNSILKEVLDKQEQLSMITDNFKCNL